MVICANPVTPELRREPLVVHKATLTSVLARIRRSYRRRVFNGSPSSLPDQLRRRPVAAGVDRKISDARQMY
jgi:hypothetical protein